MLSCISTGAYGTPSDARVAMGVYFPFAGVNCLLRGFSLRNPRGRFPRSAALAQLQLTGGSQMSEAASLQLEDARARFASSATALGARGIPTAFAGAMSIEELSAMVNSAGSADIHLLSSGLIGPAPERAMREALGNWTGHETFASAFGAPITGENALAHIGELPTTDWTLSNPGDLEGIGATFSRWVAFLEWAALRGRAAPNRGYEYNRYIDELGDGIFRAGWVRIALAMQFSLAVLRPFARLILSDAGAIGLTMTQYSGRYTTMVRAAERLLARRISPLAHAMDPGEPCSRELYGRQVELTLAPLAAAYDGVVGYIQEEHVVALFNSVDSVLRASAFVEQYDALASAMGWTQASPWVPITRVVDTSRIHPHYTDGLHVDANEPRTLDLRAYPYVMIRSAWADSTAALAISGGLLPENRILDGVPLAAARCPTSVLVQDANPMMLQPMSSVDVRLAALAPWSSWMLEPLGLEGDKEGTTRRYLSSRPSSIAVAYGVSEAYVIARITAGHMRVLFPTNEPTQPIHPHCYVSELTMSRVLGSSLTIPDARPLAFSLYREDGQSAGDAAIPIGIGQYRIDPEEPSLSKVEWTQIVDGGVRAAIPSSVDSPSAAAERAAIQTEAFTARAAAIAAAKADEEKRATATKAEVGRTTTTERRG